MESPWIHLLPSIAGGGGGTFSLIHLLLALFLAWISGELVSRMGYPSVLGELAAGIVFGPALLGWLAPSEGLYTLADIGVFLLMLYIGMEMDYQDILREFRPGFWATLGGMAIPFLTGFATGYIFGLSTAENLILASTYAATALATKSRILVDLKLLGTRLASVLIATALTTDILVLVVLALVYSLIATGDLAFHTLLATLLHVGAFFVAAVLIGHWGLPILARVMNYFGFQGRTVNFTLLLLVALTYAEMAELAGMHAILGAFIAGLFIREAITRRKLSLELREMVHDLSVGFLAPVFFVSAGFDVNLTSIQHNFGFFLAVLVGATLSKILGTMATYQIGGLPWREGMVLGSALNGRGAVGIIVAQIGMEAGVLGEGTFSSLVLMAFFTALSVPLLLKWGVTWLRRRGELAETTSRQGVIIVGAGPVGRQLASHLEGQSVVIVDTNLENCEEARKQRLIAIHGSALREDVLKQAGAETARSLIVMTPNTETNILVAQFARDSFLIPDIYVLVEAEHRETLWDTAKEEGLYPFNFGAFSLAEWKRWVADGRTRRDTVGITTDMDLDLFLETVYQHGVVLPLAVIREGRAIFFYGVDRLQAGDQVQVLHLEEPEYPIQDDLDYLIAHAPIFEWKGAADQGEILTFIAQKMAEELPLPSTQLIKMFQAREKEIPTWMAPGLAIPHILVPTESTFVFMILRSIAGVPWGGKDRKVHAIFAFASSVDYRMLHLRVLASLAQISHHADFMERFLEAKSPEEIRHLLVSIPRRRFARRYLQDRSSP